MANTSIAHFSDTHLWQIISSDAALRGSRIFYEIRLGHNEGRLSRVLSDIERRGISRVVFGGDIGAREAVACFFQKLQSHDFLFSFVPGNHDAYMDIKDFCSTAAAPDENKIYYTDMIDRTKLIFLDSADGRIGETQLDWLSSELKTSSAVALFMHHPILEIDIPIDRSGAALIDRGNIRQTLIKSNVDIVLYCGHYHINHETEEFNIRQCITPSASYQIVDDPNEVRFDTRKFGYRIIDMHDGKMQSETVMFEE